MSRTSIASVIVSTVLLVAAGARTEGPVEQVASDVVRCRTFIVEDADGEEVVRIGCPPRSKGLVEFKIGGKGAATIRASVDPHGAHLSLGDMSGPSVVMNVTTRKGVVSGVAPTTPIVSVDVASGDARVRNVVTVGGDALTEIESRKGDGRIQVAAWNDGGIQCTGLAVNMKSGFELGAAPDSRSFVRCFDPRGESQLGKD